MARLVQLLKSFVALMDHVRSNVSVQVVNVVVFDPVGEGTKQKRDLKVSTSFQSSRCEVPAVLVLSVG